MAVWLKCPNCKGEIGIPDDAETGTSCPRCRYPLVVVDPVTHVRWRPEQGAPSWMKPWGYVLTIIGGLAFFASMGRELSASHDPPFLALIIAGITNPFFFIGVPLGIYWLRRRKRCLRYFHQFPVSSSTSPSNYPPTTRTLGDLAGPSFPDVHTPSQDTRGQHATKSHRMSGRSWILFLVVLSWIGGNAPHWLESYGRPQSIQQAFNRGLAWGDKQEYDKAIADFSEAIRLNPQISEAFYNRGLAWYQKQEYNKAIMDYSEAIRLNPQIAEAFNNRGLAWYEKQEYDKAIDDFNEAIRLKPELAHAVSSRGLAWYQKHEYDKAINDFDKAIGLDGKDGELYLRRGLSWLQKKKYDKAVSDLSHAVQLNPTLDIAYINIAWVLARCPDDNCRDGRKAIEAAMHACELNGWKEAGYLEVLAAALAETGDFDSAVKWQQKANILYKDEEAKKGGERILTLYKGRRAYRFEP